MAQVILKEDIKKLGKSGDLVRVADGFARNYLLPRKKAVEATPKNLKRLEHEKRLIHDQIRKEVKSAEELAEKINRCTLTITVQAGEEGKLFGSVSSKDIAEALLKQGIQVDRRSIQLEKPLKELGTVEVPIKIHRDVYAKVNLTLVASSASS